MTRVLIAPDSFGGWISAVEFCARVSRVLGQLDGLQVDVLPLSDGGEGTTDCLLAHCDVPIELTRLSAVGGQARDMRSLKLSDGRFFESAQAIGLPAGHGSGKPLEWTTSALGEWMLQWSSQPQIIGLGGSGTVDGGIGLLRTLGLDVLDRRGISVASGLPGIIEAASIVGSPHHFESVDVWCDVRTTSVDCIRRYGPQKGLPSSWIDAATEGMKNWSVLLCEYGRHHGLSNLPIDLEGGGAAGGLGLALSAVFGASLQSGFTAFSNRTALCARLEESDWVICGEGQLDAGSFLGKPLGEVTRLARTHECGVIAVVGVAHQVPEPPLGPDVVIEIGWEPTPDAALIRSLEYLVETMGWS